MQRPETLLLANILTVLLLGYNTERTTAENTLRPRSTGHTRHRLRGDPLSVLPACPKQHPSTAQHKLLPITHTSTTPAPRSDEPVMQTARSARPAERVSLQPRHPPPSQLPRRPYRSPVSARFTDNPDIAAATQQPHLMADSEESALKTKQTSARSRRQRLQA